MAGATRQDCATSALPAFGVALRATSSHFYGAVAVITTHCSVGSAVVLVYELEATVDAS